MIPDSLSAFSGDLPQGARWTAMSGGRTNRVWRVQAGAGEFVCKLYRGQDSNPLFANDPQAEYDCLTELAGQGIAPDPVTMLERDAGTVLVYRYLQGSIWQGDPAPVAGLLRRVHAAPAPTGLRKLPVGSAAVLAQAEEILDSAPGAEADALRAMRPDPAEVGPGKTCFLHGDVVPANLLQTPDGLRLIDWQCPALGDPAEDIACFLSPAMQVIYGEGPLDTAREELFINAYGDLQVAERYRILEPAYHYRMAAYCLWRVAAGNPDYRAAFEAERAALG